MPTKQPAGVALPPGPAPAKPCGGGHRHTPCGVAPAGAHASLQNRAVRPGRVQITCRASGRLGPADGAVRQPTSPRRSGGRSPGGGVVRHRRARETALAGSRKQVRPSRERNYLQTKRLRVRAGPPARCGCSEPAGSWYGVKSSVRPPVHDGREVLKIPGVLSIDPADDRMPRSKAKGLYALSRNWPRPALPLPRIRSGPDVGT